MSESSDIAWAAGLFEGEGCISLATFGDRKTIYLILSTTDLDVLERFALVAGYGNIKPKVRPRDPAHYKQLYEWRVGHRREVTRILHDFMPWLGKRRKRDARRALREATPTTGKGSRERDKTHCKHGHPFNKKNTHVTKAGHRQCISCRDRRQARYKAEGRIH